MKQLHTLLALLFATLSLAACSSSGDDDDPEPTPGAGTLAVSPTALAFAAEGGTASFSIAGGEPFVRSQADWLTVTKSGGTSKAATYSVTAAKNTGAERTGTILVNLNGQTANVTCTQAAVKKEETITHTYREAAAIAADMFPGWNLGNTMEAPGGETAWQGTKTTQAIIDYVKAQGFRSVRIPCAWYAHATNDKIDAAWIARVKEVVDYCANAGLYVVLNDHWDNGWIEVEGFSSDAKSYKAMTEDGIKAKIVTLKTLWTQIAEAFKNYDEHLLFAGMNEPFQEYSLFNSRHKELTPILLRYNQAFVDAVRATGGNNAQRTLVVQAPGANIDSACETYFSLPTDAAAKRLMLEAHFYSPWDFCGQTDGNATWFWGKANHVAGSKHNCSWGEEDYVRQECEKLSKKFSSAGVPVIIGECGAQWRTLSANQKEHDASIKLWFQTLTAQSKKNGLVPMFWDINSPKASGEAGIMTIIDRARLSIFCQPAMDGIREGSK